MRNANLIRLGGFFQIYLSRQWFSRMGITITASVPSAISTKLMKTAGIALKFLLILRLIIVLTDMPKPQDLMK